MSRKFIREGVREEDEETKNGAEAGSESVVSSLEVLEGF
jgi:hypothetical protein